MEKERRRSRVVRTGTKLGPDLTVLGRVGNGGGGKVFIVWHHPAWCPMACKLFDSWKRARREARILAALDHPNVVRYLGLGPSTSLPYVLMEFLEGPTLRQLIRSQPGGRLSLSDAVRLAMHLGGTLSHVHARGYVHLDVKPSNVIVTTGGRPMLFDFSVARPAGGLPVHHPVGTDAYMAPEQCTGGVFSPATDIYGFGVTLYEALTGERPFPQGTRRARFPQLSADPVPLRRHLPSAPAALERIVMACLARDPGDRPSVLGAVLSMLHRFIRSGPRMWPAGFEPARRGAA
jgi:serine/threonine protein kinase